MNKQILQLAIPNIIANITVPLLGMVDLIIVGHFGNSLYIAGMAVATVIFNLIYWVFGFLRMGTSGFTAQAFGAHNDRESAAIFVRSISIALLIASCLICLQKPIAQFAMWTIDSSNEVKSLALRYFFVRIWAAPATLSIYSFNGWFIGMQNSKTPMWIAIFMNIINVAITLIFVYVLHWDIEGIAGGIVITQYSGLLMASLFFIIKYPHIRKLLNIKTSLVLSEMKSFFRVNRDIFLRTLCLTCVFSFFPIAGAKISDDILAINTLLLQFFTIFSYITDGFAYAGESLTGKYIGAKDGINLKKSVQYIFQWGTVLSAVFVIVYGFFGSYLLQIFTDDIALVENARPYFWWVLMVPICGFAAFLWDGIYIGATASWEMLISMLIATAVFFGVYYLFVDQLQNNAVWLALMIYLAARGIGQTLLSKKAIFGKVTDKS
ncbi:MAG: MATE family efflux transporter [Bacteroidales bacterium]|jgi:MATE family multidrug resistance protein|nr:MATE family efflux transporter [Bacteroidales bacterium]